jgi:Calpain large subunit, domain III
VPGSFKSYANNPQYLIDNTVNGGINDIEVFISLAQEDGRGKLNAEGEGLKFPFVEVIHPMNMCLYKLPAGKDRIEQYEKPGANSNNIQQTMLKELREVSIRIKLPIGKFVLIPATQSAGQFGKYTLSIYYAGNATCMNFARIDKDEQYSGIKEETENNLDEQDWKIQLC